MNATEADFTYRLKRQREAFSGIELEIECLENMDRTIDDLFEFLQTSGREELLEKLCPYFGVVWPSARALTRFVLSSPEEFAGKTALELGCGLALPSIAACRLGARVTATDFHPEVPRFLQRNLALNPGAEDFRYLHLDWQGGALPRERFDWVIGSDILYEKHQPELVARAIEAHLAPGGTAVIADPARPYVQPFADAMKTLGFQCETRVDRVPDPPGEKDVFLLLFKR